MEKSKWAHFKIITIYLLVGFFDYFIYRKITIDIKDLSNAKSTKDAYNPLIYYIFGCEFVFLIIKLLAKFFKLSIDLTQITMGKDWQHRILVFNMISFVRYAIKLMIEIVFYYLFRTSVYYYTR
jgi:hypothetical protein